MASVTAHVLLGSPRRFGEGLDPRFLALFRDAAHPRWQVEHLDDDNQRPARTVVSGPPEFIALGLAVAIHTAIDNPFLNAIVEPPADHRLDLADLDGGALATIERTLVQKPAALSAVITWSEGSMFGPDQAEAIVPFLSGDVEAATTVWTQIGSGHDGFGTPGQRWHNPAWGGP